MSKVVAEATHIISTDIGVMAITERVITGYSVEDIISERAHSQALVLKMLRVGKDATFTASTNPLDVQSKYKNSQESFED